jgi:hypothetical protein
MKIHSILEPFGSDKQTVTDRVRLLRIVGSIHSKTDKKIWGHSFTNDRYLFDELLEKFCQGEFEKEKERRNKNRERFLKRKEKEFQKRQNQEKQFVVYEAGKYLNAKRKEKLKKGYDSNYVGNIIHEKYRRDLIKLVNLRGGKMNGNREFCCFLIRYWTLCITDGQGIRAIREMEKLFYSMEIGGDYSFQEIVSYTRSAEKAFHRWKENWIKGYNYHNDTLVNFLSVTKEEQKYMWILIDDEETKTREQIRDTNKKREMRGSVPNEELEKEIKKAIIENPTIGSKKIALIVREKLGKCSNNKVLEIKREMKSEGLI